MKKLVLKTNQEKRVARVRKKVTGSSTRPRLSVFRSLRYCYCQLIDDTTGTTLVTVSDTELKKLHSKTTKADAATAVGKRLAELALAKGITEVVFDRRSFRYHGRVKSLAEGARAGGLKF